MAEACSDSSLDLRYEFISPVEQRLKIEVRYGDIFESTADAIVVPEGTSFKQMGFVAKHLTQIEPKYEKIRERLVGKNGSFTPWDVYTEKLGKRFKHVVCAIVPACDRDVEEWNEKFKLLYQRLFRLADRKIISVVAVPLIGSGRGGAREEDAIEMAVASAFKFKGSNINKILFVLNDKNTVELMASACRNKCGRNPQTATQARPQSSTHLSPSTRTTSSIVKRGRESPKNGTNVCSSQARPGHTHGKGLTPRDGVRGSKESEKRSKASGRGVADERNRSYGDQVQSDLQFVQQNSSSMSEEIKESKRRGQNVPRTFRAEAYANQRQDIKRCDAFHETEEEFRGTTRDQERKKGKEKHRLRDRKTELTRVNNEYNDVGRYEETYRDDVHMMYQMDRRPDVNRTNHLALHDDREGFVTGLQQKKIQNHIHNEDYDKYDDDESHHGDVDTDGRHRSIDKYSQERTLNGNSGMDENRYGEMQGNGEGLVYRSVKSTGETFNLQATRNKGQKISENRVLERNGQRGGVVTSETELKRLNYGLAELSLKDSSIEASHSKLEHREYGYQSKNKVRSNVHSESLTSKSEKNGHMYEVFGDVGSGETPKQDADDRKHSDPETKEEINKSKCVSDKQSCPICLEDMTDPKCLDKCGHVFCRDCIDDSFKHYKPVCPSCNMVYGILKGNQPDGNMDVGFSGDHLPGYEGHGTVTITYYFPSGIQGGEHPNPGQPYKGTTRRAYLPDCSEGREVLKLLKTAFDRKLTFTIGRSTTTGQENVVTWNDIHHKTNMDGGPTRFGYPDPGYMTRVKEELASKGVTG